MKKLEFPILFVIGLIAISAIFYGRMIRTSSQRTAPLAVEETTSQRPQNLATVAPQPLTRVLARQAEPIPKPVSANDREALPTPMPVEFMIAPATPVPDTALVKAAPTPEG